MVDEKDEYGMGGRGDDPAFSWVGAWAGTANRAKMILTVPPGLFDDATLDRLGTVAKAWLEDDELKVLILDDNIRVDIVETDRLKTVDGVFIFSRAVVRATLRGDVGGDEQ